MRIHFHMGQPNQATKALFASVLGLASAVAVSAGPIDECARIFEAEIADGVIHGAAVVSGGLDGDDVSASWGWADAAHKVPMTPDTVIDMASVTKASAGVTAYLVAHAKGLVDLDAPFTNCLPTYRAALGRRITLRDLANHVSGFGEADGNPRVYFSRDAQTMLHNILSMPPKEPTPGKVFYSCRNYVLLGQAFEAAAGCRAADFCRREIFDPIGMKDTALGRPPPGVGADRLAQTMGTERSGLISDFVARPLWESGIGTFNAGLFSTAKDMAKLMRVYLRGGETDNGRRIFGAPEMAEIVPLQTSRMDGARRFGWQAFAAEMPEELVGTSLFHSGWSGQTVLFDVKRRRYAVVLTTRCGHYARAKRERFAAIAALMRPVIDDTPKHVQAPSLLMIRLSAAKHTADDENWSETFRILKENRKACDEVWFPTHVGYPKMEWHRDHVRRLSRYAAQLRVLGIIPSVGFQATLGHSDAASSAAGVDGMTWSGFVGRGGTACRFCSCPRQPEFLAYMREMARLYASFRPGSVWLNDDLRIKNHKPASPGDRAKDGWIGCWCADCIQAFNVETGGQWTRESLDAAMSGDPALFDRWEKFSFDGIAAVARTIAEEVHRVSPETRLAYQHGAWRNNAQLAVFRALHEATGLAVGSRPGGGAYYDFDPRAQIVKAFGAAHQRKLLGNPEWIGIWCPEIETYPRAFASRTAQGILNEALMNLALGMNSLSLLIMDPRYEPYEWFGKTLLAPLADERPLLDAYRRHNAGAMPAGLADATTAVEPKNYVDMCDFVLAGVPVLSGVGKSYGEVRDEDVKDFKLGFMSSSALLALRHKLDERTGGRLPVVIETPSVGLVVPNVLSCGTLRSVMLENARIDVQQPLTLRLRGVPKGIDRATWWALRGKAVELPIEKSGDDALVTIPQLSAWNCGCLFVGKP